MVQIGKPGVRKDVSDTIFCSKSLRWILFKALIGVKVS